MPAVVLALLATGVVRSGMTDSAFNAAVQALPEGMQETVRAWFDVNEDGTVTTREAASTVTSEIGDAVGMDSESADEFSEDLWFGDGADDDDDDDDDGSEAAAGDYSGPYRSDGATPPGQTEMFGLPDSADVVTEIIGRDRRAAIQREEAMARVGIAATMVRGSGIGHYLDAAAHSSGASSKPMAISALAEMVEERWAALNVTPTAAGTGAGLFGGSALDVPYTDVAGEIAAFVRGLFLEVTEAELPLLIASLAHIQSRTATGKKLQGVR